MCVRCSEYGIHVILPLSYDRATVIHSYQLRKLRIRKNCCHGRGTGWQLGWTMTPITSLLDGPSFCSLFLSLAAMQTPTPTQILRTQSMVSSSQCPFPHGMQSLPQTYWETSILLSGKAPAVTHCPRDSSLLQPSCPMLSPSGPLTSIDPPE